MPQIDNAGRGKKINCVQTRGSQVPRRNVAVGASNDARDDLKCMQNVNKLENVRIPWQWFREDVIHNKCEKTCELFKLDTQKIISYRIAG